MIVSFGNKTTENIFHGVSNKKTRHYPQDIINVIERKLDFIEAAFDIKDLLSPPGNRLEKLKGDLSEFYSIRINTQFRIIFKWHNHDAHSVQVIDYH
ncbi:MAG: type II toxin-antitoxin system RelE/ParE family toxin [Fibrobacteria bacterium]|nr:type II toxin-antitoxin system RelE/ParE family toxin [Fibrobacteria bacterium]